MNQVEFELSIIDRGISKKTDAIRQGYARAKDSQEVRSVADKIFTDTFFQVENGIVALLERDLSNKKKTIFYSQIYKPVLELYDTVFATNKRNTLSHPQDVLAYIMAEHIVYAVVEDKNLTETALRTLNMFLASYGVSTHTDDNDKLLQGMLHALCTVCEGLEKFTILMHDDSSKYITVKNAADRYILEDQLDTVEPSISYLPMLEQPQDHRGLHDKAGGYHVIESPILKQRPGEFVKANETKTIVNAVNKAQKVAYTVNQDFINYMRTVESAKVQQVFSSNLDNIETMKTSLKKITKKIVSSIKASNYGCIDSLKEQQKEIESDIGKAFAYMKTLSDAELFAGKTFYHPMFCDTRGRFYYYNSSLSPQSNGFAKSILDHANQRAITDEGLEELKLYFMSMVKGYSKKKRAARLKGYEEIRSVVEDINIPLLEKIVDKDDIFLAIRVAYELNKIRQDRQYKTGIICYIDAASSAIQIAALTQKCKKSAILSSMVDNGDEDNLTDSYQNVANVAKVLIKQISEQSDSEILVNLMEYMKTNQPTRFAEFDYRIMMK